MNPERPPSGSRKLKINEQMTLWMGACFAVAVLVTGVRFGTSEEFTVVPDSALTISTALGLALMGYGLWHVTVAMRSRQPSLGMFPFIAPLLGLLAWATPIFVEAALH